MDTNIDTAQLDDLIKRRLDEILPAMIEEKLAQLRGNKPGSMTIIATKGTLDWAYRAVLAVAIRGACAETRPNRAIQRADSHRASQCARQYVRICATIYFIG